MFCFLWGFFRPLPWVSFLQAKFRAFLSLDGAERAPPIHQRTLEHFPISRWDSGESSHSPGTRQSLLDCVWTTQTVETGTSLTETLPSAEVKKMGNKEKENQRASSRTQLLLPLIHSSCSSQLPPDSKSTAAIALFYFHFARCRTATLIDMFWIDSRCTSARNTQVWRSCLDLPTIPQWRRSRLGCQPYQKPLCACALITHTLWRTQK